MLQGQLHNENDDDIDEEEDEDEDQAMDLDSDMVILEIIRSQEFLNYSEFKYNESITTTSRRKCATEIAW